LNQSITVQTSLGYENPLSYPQINTNPTMSIFDQQMRSLTVAPVMIDCPPRKIGPEIFPTAQSKLKNLFATKKLTTSSSTTPKDEYLLILTCDRLAILKGDPEGSVHGGSVHHGGINGSSSQTSLQPEAANPPFVSIPLSLLKGAHTEGHVLIIEHYLPTLIKKSNKQPSSPTSTTGIATATETLSHSTSTSSTSSTTTTSSSLLFNDDGSFSFPLISASVAAISKLRRGDAPDAGQSVLRLHTDSEETAQELAKAVHTALQRLLNALLWLDRGLPLEVETSLAVSTVSLGSGISDISKNKAEMENEVVLMRAPTWGSTVKLPPTSSSSSSSINIDICTPLGPCHATIPMQNLLSLPPGEDFTVAAVCSTEAQAAAGSLNLSAIVTIGNIVVRSTNSTSTGNDGAIASTTVNAKDAVAASTSSTSTTSTGTGMDVYFAGCIGAALALLVATIFSDLQVDLPLLVVGICLAIVMLFLQKKKKQERKNINSISVAAPAAVAVAVAAALTSQPGREEHATEGRSIKVVESFSLLHAEIIEGPGEDEFDELPSTTTNNQQQPQKPQLARQLTTSLAQRDSYLQRSSSITTSSSSFGRLKSLNLVEQKQQPGGSLVDIGAVSLRRVVSRSVESATTGIDSVTRAQQQQRQVDIYTTTQVRLTATLMEETAEESKILAKLHAISPAITPALFKRYITACGGDRKKALTRLKATAEWRANNGIDDILTSPVPRFKAIKAAYLHSVIGWTKDRSMPVVVEGMGGFKKALLQLHKDNITPAEMIQQFVFVLEWVLNDLTKDKAGSFVRIYDLKGISLFDLADKQAIALGQLMMDTLEKYYPERMAKAFVVNAPSFFATAWKMVKPMLDPRTALKIQVLAGIPATLSALQEIMDDDVIPVAYGGKNPITGYDLGFTGGWYKGEIEKQLTEMANELNS
jgi:CRAL/TRIO domain